MSRGRALALTITVALAGCAGPARPATETPAPSWPGPSLVRSAEALITSARQDGPLRPIDEDGRAVLVYHRTRFPILAWRVPEDLSDEGAYRLFAERGDPR